MQPPISPSPVLQQPARVVPAELLTALREQLSRHPQIRFAMLFGSQARGIARAESDVDLAVSAGRPLGAAEIMALIGDLGAATGCAVDLIDLAVVGEPLLGQILNHGVRLLGDSAQQAAWLTRHLIEVADFVPLQERILDTRRRQWIGR